MMKSLPVSLTKKQRILGWIWWAFQLLLLPLLLAVGNQYLSSPLSEAKQNFVFFCVNFAGITVLEGSFVLASFRQGLRSLLRTLQAAFFGLAMYHLVNLILSFTINRLYNVSTPTRFL